MELEVAVTLGIVVMFVCIVGLKAFKSYNSVEQIKITESNKTQATNLIYESRIKDIENSNRNYIYKIRKMRDSYELDYDDVEYLEDMEQDEEFKLSDLAASIYPKLPPSLAKLIDKEEFQNAIVKTVEKKPEIITTFIDKFLGNKKTEGSQTNTQVLHEKYL